MVETCPTCGLRFQREEGFFLGAIVMSFAIMLAACVGVFAVGFSLRKPGGSVVPIMIAGLGLSTVLPIVIYPFSKTLWLAVDLIMRDSMGEQFDGTGHQPGFRPKT